MNAGRGQRLSENVAIGRDGYLFHRFDRIFEQLCGQSAFGAGLLRRWISQLEDRHSWCRSQGATYLCLVVPEKHVVYRDKLIDTAISPDRPTCAILAGVAPDVRADMLYPVEPLVAARAERDTYFRTDTHLTHWGAFVAYRALVEAMSLTTPMAPISVAALRRGISRRVGDLGIYLDPEPQEEFEALAVEGLELQEWTGKRAYTVGQVEIYETQDHTKPTAVLFRDSNAQSMVQFLMSHLSRLVCVACSELYRDLVVSERPDFVITQMTEGYLAQPALSIDGDAVLFPDDHAIRGFEHLAGIGLPLPRGSDVFIIDFRSTGESAAYRGYGWSYQEADHLWMIGDYSTLRIPTPFRNKDYDIEFDVMPHVHEGFASSQRVEIAVNGIILATQQVNETGTVSLRVPATLAQQTHFDVLLRHCDGFAPEEYGPTDQRKLSLCVSEIRLREARPEATSAPKKIASS